MEIHALRQTLFYLSFTLFALINVVYRNFSFNEDILLAFEASKLISCLRDNGFKLL